LFIRLLWIGRDSCSVEFEAEVENLQYKDNRLSSNQILDQWLCTEILLLPIPGY